MNSGRADPGALQRLIRRLQFLDVALPPRVKVELRYWAQRRFHDIEPEVRLLPILAPPSQLAIDVGANFGLYTVALVELGRTVTAFEPLPACANALIAWGRGRPVTVHQCALADQDADGDLFVPRSAGRDVTTRASLFREPDGAKRQRVRIRKLDTFDIGAVGFIKIDTEGGELPVLRGAARTIRRWRPNLLLEVDAAALTASALRDTFALLTTWNYSAFLLGQRGLERYQGGGGASEGSGNIICLPAERHDSIVACVEASISGGRI